MTIREVLIKLQDMARDDGLLDDDTDVTSTLLDYMALIGLAQATEAWKAITFPPDTPSPSTN
jgi:hypothetical protein